VPNKEVTSETFFGASGTDAGAGTGVEVEVEVGGGVPAEPKSTVTAKGLLNADVVAKKFGIPDAVVAAVATAGTNVSDFEGCGVGGATEIVGSDGTAGAMGSDSVTGLGADTGADGFDNENGSALIGGSLAFVTSWGIGVCGSDEIMYACVQLVEIFTSFANVNPAGISNKGAFFAASSSATLSSSIASSSSSNAAENLFACLDVGRSM